jgi:hypothetical protein
MDDEYFRLCLCMKEETGGHPDAKANLPTIFRSLNRPEAEGFKRAVLQSSFVVPQITPSGLYIGQRSGFNVDLTRLFRVVERTVRGLYFHETGKRIVRKYGVQVISDDSLRSTPRKHVRELQDTIVTPLAHTRAKVIGTAFSYRFQIMPKPPISAWGLTFYNAVSFVALIGPHPDSKSSR